ncbi:mechanosensitive ion channel family protein [Desulfatirhabdium butyrativorans]|uniref:mechanosensitive ion channel family protein n=1 Tax=Desulfatirhabdium butyrativorans TaxID=340467 RepID=UPI0004131F45|nr:mechanosensitive ion channel family protein [Desulfatirhabdium butyrativorans]
MFQKIIIYQNPIQDWLIAAGIAILFYAAVYVAKRVIHRKLASFAEKTATGWDNLLAGFIDRLNPIFILVLAVYFGSLKIVLPGNTHIFLGHTLGIIALIQFGILLSHAIHFWVERFRKKKIESNAGAVTTLISVGFVLRMVTWIILLLIGLDNLGINITTLIAGLGISGIAVALAIQNILSDLFGSFSIVLDKPFVIGDFIVIDSYMGTVEHIGLKTTRIRSLSGEQLIFSNADLLKSRIRNYKRMMDRRVVFSIDVVYETSYEQIKSIPNILQGIIEKMDQVRFDRAHFSAYGDYALQFEVVYWVLNPDYNVYMDIQQAINLEIFRRFSDAGIQFAYPTQALIMQASPDGAGLANAATP